MAWLKYLNKLVPNSFSSSLSSDANSSGFIQLTISDRRRCRRRTQTKRDDLLVPKLIVSNSPGCRLTKIKNPIITINKNSFRTNNHFSHQSIGKLLQPIAESSVILSRQRIESRGSVCSRCHSQRSHLTRPRFCVCCGKQLVQKSSARKRMVEFDTRAVETLKRRKLSEVRVHFNGVDNHPKPGRTGNCCSGVKKPCLKKSKAMTNINPKDTFNGKLVQVRNDSNERQNIVTTFSVDFASTPIKLAPKTSTPKKGQI